MGKGFEFKSERFIMNMPEEDIQKVEVLARENGVTMSWVYRAVLFALLKKFSISPPNTDEIHRPLKFNKRHRKVTVCMYGDKKKWMTLSRIWQVELGPLIRFGLKLVFKGELLLDLESVDTVKEVKFQNPGKMKIQKKQNQRFGCIYLFQNEAVLHPPDSFRVKNPARNSFLMEMGIRNRKY